MRILHVLAPGRFGGLERVVTALAEAHAAGGHEVHLGLVLEPDARLSPLFLELDDSGVGLHVCRLAGRAYARERRWAEHLCAELRPDVVHTHGYRADVIDGRAARRQRIATITTVHGFTGGGLRNRIYESIQRRAFRRFDAVVAVSSHLEQELSAAGIRRERLRLIRNGVPPQHRAEGRADARRFFGVGEEAFHVGWVGRLSEEKGADVFIDALAGLKDVSTLRASIVGEGPVEAEARRRVLEHGLADRVRFMGFVEDASRYFPGLDVLVVSSRTEGIPMVLLEAMGMTVPTVVTRVGGVPEVVGPSESLLVPPENPKALAAAIRSCIDEPDATARRARAALQRLAGEFALARWAERYLEVYAGLRGESRTRVRSHA